jgi:hypothetical protein
VAEIDCVESLITQDLVETFDGITIPYNGTDHTAVAAFQRAVDEFGDQYPYVEVCGPVGQITERSSRSEMHQLDYTVLVYVAANDKGSNDPITYQLRNTRAYVMAQALTDRTREGHAINTEYNGNYGHYFIEETSEIVLFFGLRVTVGLSAGDPFTRTA